MKVSRTPLNEEVAAIQADPLFALIKTHREQRSRGWLDYVGYTRDKTVKTQTIRDVEQAAEQTQLRIDGMRNAK